MPGSDSGLVPANASRHPLMSSDELQETYREAWDLYFTAAHA